MHMKLNQTGSVFVNNGLWYYSVRLPGEKRRRQVPLRAPNSNHTMRADRPRKMAEDAAARYWEEHTRQNVRNAPGGVSVADLCAAWDAHCREYYKGSSTSMNAIIDVRMFRDLFGQAAVAELTHADMLQLRDALVRSGVSRTTVNLRLWRVKYMLAWALDEAIIPAAVKAELTQVRGVKRGRTSAPERQPVRPVDDDVVERTCRQLAQNTADMVRVHRLTGMRPGEVCAMSWEDIDTGRTPWVYRPREHKNDWRMKDRAVLIGPKARAILKKYRRFPRPFSPFAAIEVEMRRKESGKSYSSVPNEPRERWTTAQYLAAVKRAALRAGFEKGWAVNRLRHTFATSVRRSHGLVAAGALLGHEDRLRVTNIYSFEAAVDDLIREFGSVVEAIG